MGPKIPRLPIFTPVESLISATYPVSYVIAIEYHIKDFIILGRSYGHTLELTSNDRLNYQIQIIE